MLWKPHTLTVITPGETTDGYGDTTVTYAVPPATTREIRGHAQPQSSMQIASEEAASGARVAVTWQLVVYTTDGQITARDRVEWRGTTYEVDGQPSRWDSPLGGHHHTEVRLRAVRG